MENVAEDLTSIEAPEDNTEEAQNNAEQTHIVPEIEIKDRFFNFTDNKDYLTLKLTKNGVRAESADLSISKNLSYQGMIKALSNQASLDTGLLPLLGSDYVAVRRYMVHKTRHIAFIEATPKVRNIIFQTNDGKDSKFTIPFPGLLLCVVMKEASNGKLTFDQEATKLFALQSSIFNEKTKVYKYPFSNDSS